LPQLARVALVPVSADSFMKERRFILIMTGKAVVGRALLPVAIDAKTHGVIHDALRHRHLRDLSVTSDAIDLRADVRRMVETHVRLFVESVDALPRHVFVPLCMVAQRLDTRIGLIPEIFVTVHADIDTGNSGARALLNAKVAVGASDADVGGMNLMRKIDRLLRLGSDVKKMFRGIAETAMRRCKFRRAPPLRHIRINSPSLELRDVGLLHAAGSDRPKEQQNN